MLLSKHLNCLRLPAGLRRSIRRVNLLRRSFGFLGLARRVSYVLKIRGRWYELRLPTRANFDGFRPLPVPPSVDLARIRQEYRTKAVSHDLKAELVREANQLTNGYLRFFGGKPLYVSWPPSWRTAPTNPQQLPLNHWSRLGQLPEDLDIKDVWEPSRFGFTFLLARAYAMTEDDQFAESWWSALEDWAINNPPNSGPNWLCGQESSLRGIAIHFGLSVFCRSASTTPARVELASRILAATYSRVRPTVGYALSQRNNHAVSEITFLLGVKERPSRRLQYLLRQVLRDQWYPDGSYSQQSPVYQRLATHALIWLLHTQSSMNKKTRSQVHNVISMSAAFLKHMSDHPTGRMFNSGANDGAMLLDLDITPRADIRPTLSLAGLKGVDAVHEASIWFPPEKVGLPGPVSLSSSTYHVLRGRGTALLCHVGDHRHRPGHDDQQSIELIADGEPIILDPGTFRYSGPLLWRQPFTSIASHSSLIPMIHRDPIRLGRFLHDSLPPAVCESRSDEQEESLITRRRVDGVELIRRIFLSQDVYIIVDRAVGGDGASRWLLPSSFSVDTHSHIATDGKWIMEFMNLAELSKLPRDETDPNSGWWSPTYGELKPATVVSTRLKSEEFAVTVVRRLGQDPPDDQILKRFIKD